MTRNRSLPVAPPSAPREAEPPAAWVHQLVRIAWGACLRAWRSAGRVLGGDRPVADEQPCAGRSAGAPAAVPTGPEPAIPPGEPVASVSVTAGAAPVASGQTPSLFEEVELTNEVVLAVRAVLKVAQPSAWELLAYLEDTVSAKARWVLADVLKRLAKDPELSRASKAYLQTMLASDDLAEALRGEKRPGKEIESSIDALVREGAAYRDSKGFTEMVSFMANFRDYAPFNNMLVKVQNPNCSFYATRRDWEQRFARQVKEDARPMLILAPMCPVMLVYDLDETEGEELPEEIRTFAKYEGEWDERWLERTIDNAAQCDGIRVQFKELSTTRAGFAESRQDEDTRKLRIVIHDKLNAASRYGVLCHELAHVYLGHLGATAEDWWPSRGDLDRRTVEVEAEASAYIITRRAGLTGTSATYVSKYLNVGAVPRSVSLDQVAKVANHLQQMATRKMRARRRRRGAKRGAG